jgi:Domain of unknown function (DUF5916)
MLKVITSLVLCLYAFMSISQIVPKNLPAQRTNKIIKIDGILDEEAWKDAPKMVDFVEFRPFIGRKEEQGNHTETYLMYSDDGIYFGGTCHERDLDSIATELSGRDGFGTNDYIGIAFDTYGDKLNGFEYFVTPLNEQWDAKMSSNNDSQNGGEDFSWNAVWKSAVVKNSKGWSFEIFLPFSAIRFSTSNIQDWGMNVTRRRRKTEQQFTWRAINPNINGYLTQAGKWTGITNIKPPIRLQFSPYFSTYANHYPSNIDGKSNWSNQFSGGLDVKWGLSQSFTLDATLIPDFGQVQSDNQVLNLTPFEVKFNENRSFFTEGTELFSKGNLFYSRRIGGQPLHKYDAYEAVNGHESVTNNPSESKLINATKISGRTKGGLGIGILNAITRPTVATLTDSLTGNTREYETDPTTNYNIFVLDQTLKYNSSISLVNTSVLRGGNDYNANVTAGLFSFFDKKNTYNFSGSAAISNLAYKAGSISNSMGYSHTISFGKTSGRFNFNVYEELTDTKYNSNDLGYFTNNNYFNHGLYLGYRYTVPKSFYNRLNINFGANISHLYTPIGDISSTYQNSNIRFNISSQLKTLHWAGVFFNYLPTQNDFYEPRTEGMVFSRGASMVTGAWFEGNSSKKYSISVELFRRTFFDFYNTYAYDISFGQSYRFNSKLTMKFDIAYNPRPISVGYSTMIDDKPFFALREISTIENILKLKYSFTNRMGLTFRARHYTSVVSNKVFFNLNPDGTLKPNNSITGNYDRNVNYFNIDMVYTWQFAPGSFFNLVWKDSAITSSNISNNSYGENLNNTLQSSHNNSISLKVIYFLDYLSLKKSARLRES